MGKVGLLDLKMLLIFIQIKKAVLNLKSKNAKSWHVKIKFIRKSNHT